MRRIAIINQKGGVGKTTTTANLAAALAQAGKKTFLIDLDPQGHLGLHFGLNVQPDQATVYDVLTASTPIAEAKVSVRENIDVLPADIDLAAAEAELVSVTGREVLLREAVDAFGNGYDALLIDCAPSLGVLTINALAACTEVVIPLQAHFFGLQGLSKLLETVLLVRQRINPQLKVSGIALCMHEASTRLATEIAEDLTKFLEAARGSNKPWAGAQLYQTPIRRNIKLAESSSFGQTVFDYAPRSNGAADYANLAAEIFPDLPKPAAIEEEPGTAEPIVTKTRAAAPRDVPAKRVAEAAQPAAQPAPQLPARPALQPPAVVNPPARPPSQISNRKSEISNFESQISNLKSEIAKPKAQESNLRPAASNPKPPKSNLVSPPASKVTSVDGPERATARAKVKNTMPPAQPAPMAGAEPTSESGRMRAVVAARPKPAKTESPVSTVAPLAATVPVTTSQTTNPTSVPPAAASPIGAQPPAAKPIRRRSLPHTAASASGPVAEQAAPQQAQVAGV